MIRQGSSTQHEIQPWRSAGEKTSLRVGTEKGLHLEDREQDSEL